MSNSFRLRLRGRLGILPLGASFAAALVVGVVEKVVRGAENVVESYRHSCLAQELLHFSRDSAQGAIAPGNSARGQVPTSLGCSWNLSSWGACLNSQLGFCQSQCC